jgi:hypothetical protein
MTRTTGVLACALLAWLPATAHAQSAPRSTKWTIEFYGGRSATSASSSGTAVDGFTPAVPFTMVSGQPTRSVSSWFFGDGALLLNQTLTQFSNINGTTFPRITPLDASLLASGGSRGGGGLLGIRVSRDLSERLAIELSIERLAQLQLTDDLKGALQEASDSFKAAFEALFATAPTGNPDVSSMLTLREGSRQTKMAVAAKWTVLTRSRWAGYLSAGGGITINGSEGPSAVLNGRYRFAYLNLYPFDETDRVLVSVSQPKNSAMGLVGGGVTYDLFSSIGLRADVRLLFNSTKDVTRLAAAPDRAVTNQISVMATVTSPGLQFSTTPGIQSSFSGPNVNITLFRASGFSKQIAFSLGIFKRF